MSFYWYWWRIFQKLVVRTRLCYLRFSYRSSWQFLFQKGFTTINVICLCYTGIPYPLKTHTIDPGFLLEFVVFLFCICFFSVWLLVNSSYIFSIFPDFDFFTIPCISRSIDWLIAFYIASSSLATYVFISSNFIE